jgi:hypothetical protein
MGGGKVKSVRFAYFGDEIASSRLRGSIPQSQLRKMGYPSGNDVLVYGKHNLTFQDISAYTFKVFDICDDHFSRAQIGDYYRAHAKAADAVTVNSETMRDVVLRETGRTAIVIPDPYESEERLAGRGEGLLWFGHPSNLKTLDDYNDLGIRILTYPDWSRERQLEELEKCAIVVLPTDDRKAKSANRLIEAVRNGRFVVAGELPAHEEFRGMMWVGDIRTGLAWATENPGECTDRVIACQDYIRDRFSPETISKQWAKVIDGLQHA